MSILVNGGAGYIGAHVVRLLQHRGDEVVVVDDLSNSTEGRIGNAEFHQFDLAGDEAVPRLEQIMREQQVTAVVHFAAKKRVDESVSRPAWYYQQNIGSLANTLEAMQRAGVRDIVFSSSAGVYGEPEVPASGLIAEDIPHRPINPYGETKFVGEWMIADAERAYGVRGVSLRYFNVAGAGWDDLGDPGIMNLIPAVFARLEQGRAPAIFGTDYPTPDGTCVRDYIHVKDLADAHLAALGYLQHDERPESVFNVGTGDGFSVQEVVDEVLRVTGSQLQPEIRGRRAGDPPRLVADNRRISTVLDWHAQHDLRDIVESAWAAWRHAHDAS
jgi:UDP-glucose 4-epimerase